MQRDDVRKAVTAQFYQSLSESGVQITAIPQNQLQAVVNALADGVFAAIAAVEAQTDTLTNNVAGATRAAAPQRTQVAVHDCLFWSGAVRFLIWASRNNR